MLTDISLTIGVVGLALLPVWAAPSAIVARITEATLVIKKTGGEMKEQKEDKLFGILRLAVFVFAAGLVFITVIAGAGWLMGWRTTTEFSNGFFIVGAIAAVFGAYSTLGGFGMRGHPGVNVARTASPASLEERNRQMYKDMLDGNNFAVVLVIVGLLLIGFAVAIPNIFG